MLKTELLDESNPNYTDKVKQIDHDVLKNKFSKKWLDEVTNNVPFRTWLAKRKESGVAFCRRCASSISYRSMGKKVLHQHAKTPLHKKCTNYSLHQRP